jgi:hypothetical protein
MLGKLLLRYVFRLEKEKTIVLGSIVQTGSMYAAIDMQKIWGKEKLTSKLKSIFQLRWKPSVELIDKAAKETFMRDIFGGESDYGEALFRINLWHNSREWNLNDLTENDKARADALDSMTILTRLRYRSTAKILHLNLFAHVPFMCILTHAMIVKIPIISLQYFLTVHSRFAFNSIRKAKHPNGDKIIDYLYEILYVQQKIAISLHEFIRLIDYNEKKKKEALFIGAEINAIMSADLVFLYLKSSIEKIIILIGETHGINNLDAKKHKAKLSALKEGLPTNLLNIYYVEFMFEFFSSENIDELNNYRSGLLHKRGIADLQPHNYVRKDAKLVPLKKILLILQEQFSKNTAVLLGALAILTDKLVDLDRPNINYEDLSL